MRMRTLAGPRCRQSDVLRAALLFVAPLLVCGCGDRTPLLLSDYVSQRDGSAIGDEGGASSDGGTLCSLYEGPVDSCDAGGAAGPVQRCTPDFSVCTDTEFPAEGWGCCVPNPPERLYDCAYSQFIDDASCR
jgi:hypothetical protein